MLCEGRQGTVSHIHYLDEFSPHEAAVREEDGGCPWRTWNLWCEALGTTSLQSKSSWYLTRRCRLQSDYSNGPDVTCAQCGGRAGANSGHLGMCLAQPPGPASMSRWASHPDLIHSACSWGPQVPKMITNTSVVVMMRCFSNWKVNYFFSPPWGLFVEKINSLCLFWGICLGGEQETWVAEVHPVGNAALWGEQWPASCASPLMLKCPKADSRKTGPKSSSCSHLCSMGDH